MSFAGTDHYGEYGVDITGKTNRSCRIEVYLPGNGRGYSSYGATVFERKNNRLLLFVPV